MFLRARALGLAMTVGLLACLALAGSASAAVYWGVNEWSFQPRVAAVGAASFDGGAWTGDYLKDLESPGSTGSACGVAVTATHLFWAGDRGIGAVNLDGPAVPRTIVPNLNGPCGVETDQTHVYWADAGSGSIGRAAVDGTAVEPAFLTGLRRPCAVALSGSSLYWVEAGTIGRVNLDGSGLKRNFLPGSPASGCALEIRGAYAYWGVGRGIARASLDGSEYDPDFVAAAEGVSDIATDASHIYWAARPSGSSPATIGRARLDGTESQPTWIPAATEMQSSILGVAVDARPTPPPLILPGRPIRFGKAKHHTRAGTVVLDVWVPDWGTLDVGCPGLRCRVIADTTPNPEQGGYLRWRAFLKPLKGRAGLRIRNQLKRKGVASATVNATFTSKRSEPVSAVRHLKIRKQVKRPNRR